MDQTAQSIKGVMNNVRVQLGILDAEIKASEKSKLEYERQLNMLEARKSDLLKRIKRNTEWAATYDLEVGPFAARYQEMTAEIGILYNKAKVGHTKGILLLENEFGYHPAFLHPGDTFTYVTILFIYFLTK